MSEPPFVRKRPGFRITSDPEATDLDLVCGFLRGTYWAGDVPRQVLEASFRSCLVYNLIDLEAGAQAGFGRVLSDRARFAWLSDVFVLDRYRGRGLGTWLVATIMADPRLQAVQRWLLATEDAHGFYRRCGWEDAPEGRYMVFVRDP